RELGRKVLTCFVLRYTPFYRTVKQFIDSGRLGKIISLRAFEGVEPWHQAHSFVRGHWSRAKDSTPMIVAKCCHDMDILSWLVDSPHRRLSSFGKLSYFRKANAPEGATARCTDGCPHCGTCPYDAHRYLGDKKATWLPMVHPTGIDDTNEQLIGWLESSPWGRCVYHCDNDVVDHQTVNIEFENDVTATFTMTAFDDGRRIEIYGTEGALVGKAASYRDPEEKLTLTSHHNPGSEEIEITKAAGGHGGGDQGLVDELHKNLTENEETGLLQDALRGLRLAFDAETARTESNTVEHYDL
ncbi:MAG: putative dehydrogenase, partial [Verrucomicrobiales bacterium]